MSDTLNTDGIRRTGLRLGHLLEEFDERLETRDEPEILTLTEKKGFVSQRERFNKRLAIPNTGNYKVIHLHDIAFNPYLLWAGAIAQNTRWDSAIVSPLYPTLHVREGYSPRYVNYVLRSGLLRPQFESISFGSVPRKRRAALSDFLNLVVPTPPSFAEQERIADLLDQADDLRRLRDQADRRATELMPALFYEMFGDPGANPKNWRLFSLVDLISEPLRNGLSPSSSGCHPAKVLTLSAVTGDGFDESAWKEALLARQPEESCLASEHVFLICRGNGNRNLVGRGRFPRRLLGRYVFPDTMIAAVPDSGKILPMFFETVWDLPSTRSQVLRGARTTNGTFKINQEVLRDVRLPVPPSSLQQEFDDRTAKIQDIHARQAASRQELDSLFQSMLDRALRGEL